jgi:hypothetical protein
MGESREREGSLARPRLAQERLIRESAMSMTHVA